MKLRILTLAGLAVAAWVSLFPGFGEAPVATEPLPFSAPAANAAVRIEHEIVTVPEIRQQRPRNRLVRPAVHRTDPAGRAPHAAPLARARRVLFGDGTYRPEPFPRPSR